MEILILASLGLGFAALILVAALYLFVRFVAFSFNKLKLSDPNKRLLFTALNTLIFMPAPLQIDELIIPTPNVALPLVLTWLNNDKAIAHVAYAEQWEWVLFVFLPITFVYFWFVAGRLIHKITLPKPENTPI